MYFFSITPVTASAAATLFGASALYSAVTGVPYFLDSEIPSAVFLGLHLLVTDPSTSPRTPFGRSDFRRALRAWRFRALFASRRHRRADVLRQADVRAAAESQRPLHRPAGARHRASGQFCTGSAWMGRSAAATSRTWRSGWCSLAP